MDTYREKTQAELNLTDEEWADLNEFLESLHPRIQSLRQSQEIAIEPPHIKPGFGRAPPRFAPKGWVGRYPGNIIVKPDKLSEEEFDDLKRDIAGWLEVWDIPTASIVLPIFQEEAQDDRAVLLGYSRALRDYTERALSGRPPVNVSHTVESGPVLNGSLKVEETLLNRATGSQEVVYNAVNFSFKSLANMLLVRFHAELAREFAKIAQHSMVLTERFQKRHRYHEEFLHSGMPVDILEESLSIDFHDPLVLDRVRGDLPDELIGVIDLWEAYQQRQAMSIGYRDQLDIGIKPASTLYELWLLRLFFESLQDLLDEPPEPIGSGFRKFAFGPEVTLHYDTVLEEYSQFLIPEMDTHPGRPDFLLEVNNQIVFVGEAKFKYGSTIDLADSRQLLSYMVDLLPGNGIGTAGLCYISDRQQSSQTQTDSYTLASIPLRPQHKESQKSQLQSVLSNCLANIATR